MTRFLVAASLCSLALANPVHKRQAVSSAAEAVSSAAGALSSATAAVSSAASSVIAPVSSAASSIASGVVGSASSAAASASASAAPYSNPAYPCPQGELAYDIGVVAFPDVDFATGLSHLYNWASQEAIFLPVTASSGTNETGATRTLDLGGSPAEEVLTNYTLVDNILHGTWNITAPLVLGDITIYTTEDDFTYYMNSTTGAPTIQLFTNFCVSNQSAGIAALNVPGSAEAYGAVLRGTVPGAASASASGASSMMSMSGMSSMMSMSGVPAAASAVSSGLSSVAAPLSSASAAVESATELLSSVAAAATA